MVWVNLVCNILLTLSGASFYLMLYGNSSSVVHRWPLIHHWSLRVGLSAFVAGAFLNALTLSNPPMTEVLMNVGLALIFIWGVTFHYRKFNG